MQKEARLSFKRNHNFRETQHDGGCFSLLLLLLLFFFCCFFFFWGGGGEAAVGGELELENFILQGLFRSQRRGKEGGGGGGHKKSAHAGGKTKQKQKNEEKKFPAMPESHRRFATHTDAEKEMYILSKELLLSTDIFSIAPSVYTDNPRPCQNSKPGIWVKD